MISKSSPTPPIIITMVKKICKLKFIAIVKETTQTATIEIRRIVVKEQLVTTRSSRPGRIWILHQSLHSQSTELISSAPSRRWCGSATQIWTQMPKIAKMESSLMNRRIIACPMSRKLTTCCEYRNPRGPCKLFSNSSRPLLIKWRVTQMGTAMHSTAIHNLMSSRYWPTTMEQAATNQQINTIRHRRGESGVPQVPVVEATISIGSNRNGGTWTSSRPTSRCSRRWWILLM